MTEPKPTRFLSARLREYAEGWGQMFRDLVEHPALDNDVPEECDCPPCPGKGLDGNGMNHCAECCWGSRVIADIDCPIHGKAAY